MDDYHKHDKCDCCKSMQGEQGPQGIQGPRGQDGLQGPQGIQGMQGIPGSCVNCFEHDRCECPDPEFAEVGSIVSQDLAASPGANMPGGVVLLETPIFATANIDISQAAAFGQVKVMIAGWYKVNTGVCGSLNPVVSPLPVWTFSVFKNGVIVPGSTFANMTISPEQKANEIVSIVLVHLNAGDILTLANTSTSNVLLNAPTLGTNAQTSSAYMVIDLMKAD